MSVITPVIDDTPPVLATVEDYSARYGDVSEADAVKLAELIEDAAGLVLGEVEGSVAEWVIGDGTVPRPVVMVVVAAARRALKNEAGVVREQLGEHAVTYRADGSWDIWLTGQEVRMVRKAARLGALTSVTLVSPYSGDTADAVAHIYDNDLPL